MVLIKRWHKVFIENITPCWIKCVSSLVLWQIIPKRGKGVGWLVPMKRKGYDREGGRGTVYSQAVCRAIGQHVDKGCPGGNYGILYGIWYIEDIEKISLLFNRIESFDRKKNTHIKSFAYLYQIVGWDQSMNLNVKACLTACFSYFTLSVSVFGPVHIILRLYIILVYSSSSRIACIMREHPFYFQ